MSDFKLIECGENQGPLDFIKSQLDSIRDKIELLNQQLKAGEQFYSLLICHSNSDSLYKKDHRSRFETGTKEEVLKLLSKTDDFVHPAAITEILISQGIRPESEKRKVLSNVRCALYTLQKAGKVIKHPSLLAMYKLNSSPAPI